MDWIRKALDSAKVKRTRRATFASAFRDADVHLVERQFVDGTILGAVTCDGERLYFGRHAEHVFLEMQAREEAFYMIMRAKVRAICGGKLPHED